LEVKSLRNSCLDFYVCKKCVAIDEGEQLALRQLLYFAAV